MSYWTASRKNGRKGLETGCLVIVLGNFAVKGSREIRQKVKMLQNLPGN